MLVIYKRYVKHPDQKQAIEVLQDIEPVMGRTVLIKTKDETIKGVVTYINHKIEAIPNSNLYRDYFEVGLGL